MKKIIGGTSEVQVHDDILFKILILDSITSPPAVALTILNCFFFFKPWITFPKSHKYDAQITDFISVNFASIIWCFMLVVRRCTGAVAGAGTEPRVCGTEVGEGRGYDGRQR